MIANTLRSEYIKLRTILSHWVLVIIAIAFPVVIVTLVSILGDFGAGIQSDEVSSLIVGLSVVSAMLLGAMSAISLTADYGHSTIRPTYAATPNRLQVIGSKLTVNSIVVLMVSAFTVFGSWIVSSSILSARDNSVAIGDDGVLPSLVSVVALAVIVSLFALGLGLIIRNSPATVTILLLWPLLIEGLIGVVFAIVGWDGANKWLPYQAAIEAAASGENGSTNQLGRPMGLIYFAAVSVALIAIGATLDQRRDA